jgi:hypothetical protein
LKKQSIRGWRGVNWSGGLLSACLVVACAAARVTTPATSVVNVASIPGRSEGAGAADAALPETPSVNVVLLVNAQVAAANRVGAQLGPLVRRFPPWAELELGTGFDFTTHVDWLTLSGPSFIKTDRDIVLMHVDAPASAVDGALASLSRHSAVGAPFDAGVPGVMGVTAYLDGADRVIVRSGGLVAILPPALAAQEVPEVATTPAPELPPNVAVSVDLRQPWRAFPALPRAIERLRARVETRPDQGADLVVACEVADPRSVAKTAEALRALLAGWNTFVVDLATGGLLEAPGITTAGSTVTVKLSATETVLQKLFDLANATLK